MSVPVRVGLSVRIRVNVSIRVTVTVMVRVTVRVRVTYPMPHWRLYRRAKTSSRGTTIS